MGSYRFEAHGVWSTLITLLATVGRHKLTLSALAVGVLILPAALQGQATSRFQVLIPYFQPRGDSDDDFGKDASEKLRELTNTLPTHVAMDKDEVEAFDI